MATNYVTTVKERCRMCYTCVRECPAKAIRVATGQAEVVDERCIACGNCVLVCSQDAKRVRSATGELESLLRSGRRVAVCLAPSFPAAFPDVNHQQLAGMLRTLGFALVLEVSFGADLVAREYRRLLGATNGRGFIATTCPAVTSYVEKYYPEFVGSLAPIVSPMVATARAARKRYGDDLAVVFIGPCIAKKAEAASPAVAGDVDEVLTFEELQQLFDARGLEPDQVEPSAFDPPYGGPGGVFPIGRGLLQASNIEEDLMNGEVVATQGRSQVLDAIQEFASGDLGAKLLEALCCEGCIAGAGIHNSLPLFSRRRLVQLYVCSRMESLDQWHWQENLRRAESLNLSRSFQADDQRTPLPEADQLQEVMARMGKDSPKDQLNCGACGYDTCREHAVAICKGLAENTMCLPYTIDQLCQAVREVEASNRQLAEAQDALIQSEKLASMGQLAAGIAHEVNNPLGVVLMYSHLLLDACPDDSPLRSDLTMITEQADRCKKIVAGLLHFARQNKVVRYPADLRDLVHRALRAVRVPANIQVCVEHQLADPIAEVDRDQIVQVLTNLVTNALAAMEMGGTLTVRTSDTAERVVLSVTDTGGGIPEENMKKIFDPFFTTKPMGKGTGLGLAVTYGIMKMHCGDIRVQSQADPAAGPTGTTFTLVLPRRE
jgi:signal transduction histidine kinase/Pyruvate/2-oxoacid:ferredoxin oxidoreductase delta subunit